MNNKCNRCNWEIAQLNLSDEQKLEVLSLLKQDLKLFAIQYLHQKLQFNLTEAKGIILHSNKDFGVCHRCDYAELAKDNMECPKCKAFNYNLKVQSTFNQEFCEHLEWKLDFDDLGDERLKGFWCDGVDHFPSEIKSLFKSNLAKKRVVKTKAWIGKTGQDIYEMEIFFGEKSIENYLQNKSLLDCIPENNYKNWIEIDPILKSIKVKLK